MVLPKPWKTLELLKTMPEARKLSDTIVRYSDPNAITCGSRVNPRMNIGANSHALTVSTAIIADASPIAANTVCRTRSARRPPKFCPTTGATAKLNATTGKNIACITRAPTPKPACAAAPNCRMMA